MHSDQSSEKPGQSFIGPNCCIEDQAVFKTVVDNSPVAIGISTPEGRHYYQNKAFSDLFEKLGEHSYKSPFVDVVVGKEIFRAIISGDQWAGDVQMYGKEGQILDIDLHAYPTFDRKGNIVSLVGIHNDISARKENEKALLNERKFIDNTIDSLPGVFYLFTKDGKLLKWNRDLEKCTGYSSDEIAKMKPTDFFPESEHQLVINEINEVFSKGESFIEANLLSKNGSSSPHYFNGTRIEIDGKPCQLGMGLDISELRSAKDALRESEERFSIAFRYNPAALSISERATGRFIDVNDRCAQLLEFSREEQIGKTSVELGVWDNPDDRDKMVGKIATEGRFVDEPVVFRSKSGKKIHSLWSAESIKVSGQKVLLSMFLDITDRKVAEEALRESRAELHNLINAIPDMVWACDENECFTFASESWRTITGYSTEELIGKSFYELMADKKEIGSRSCEEFRNGVKEKFDGYKGKQQSYKDFLNWNIHKDGSIRCHSSSAVPRYDTEGNFKGYIGIDKDVTDRIKAEEEQKKLHEQLVQAQKMESIGRLAGGVAHDFNNMLSVILGSVDLAQHRIDKNINVDQSLKEIQNAALRSAELIRQLLGFARKQAVSPKVLDLNVAVGNMLKMLKRLIGENIELIWKPDTDLWQVKIDPSQVDQIFTNLAVNAHDAIESHGTVIIETKNAVIDPDYLEGYKHFKTGDFVMFSVHDTGNGMDKQTIEKIFEPFYTTKPQGKGTGLGLSTVYGIVKQNNGFINVYSEPGTGTTFKIFLPRQEVKKNVQTKATSTSELKRGSETILLVEDEASILEIGKRMLEALGYAVLPASKPSIALEKSKEYKSKIDLLVTDVMMPEMNGRELSTILSETYPGIKTLYMSGYTSSIIAHNGILDDEVHFIQKPFTTVSLSEKVRKALSNTE